MDKERATKVLETMQAYQRCAMGCRKFEVNMLAKDGVIVILSVWYSKDGKTAQEYYVTEYDNQLPALADRLKKDGWL